MFSNRLQQTNKKASASRKTGVREGYIIPQWGTFTAADWRWNNGVYEESAEHYKKQEGSQQTAPDLKEANNLNKSQVGRRLGTPS